MILCRKSNTSSGRTRQIRACHRFHSDLFPLLFPLGAALVAEHFLNIFSGGDQEPAALVRHVRLWMWSKPKLDIPETFHHDLM